MRISGDWISHAGTQELCLTLERAGHTALFVGGCVRNAILGQAVNDIDVSTDALPETVSNIAENAGFKVVPTGIEHGTLTVIALGQVHEVTTFRRDIETDGRRAVVAFSDRIEDDASRRDFTMNALYADRNGQVIDPLGGLPDLLAHRVRFVGDPEERIREDYLRILRFFRFHAHYGDPVNGFDADGLAACAANSSGLERLSKERIGAEMRKLLMAADPVPAIGTMTVCGILSVILPGADPKALGPFLHLSALHSHHPGVIARLAALGGVSPVDDLRLSKAEARQLFQLRDAVGSVMAAGELGYRLGPDDGLSALLLRAALLGGPVSGVEDVLSGAMAKFPVRAADLPNFKGPELGARLKSLETKWIVSGFVLSRDELLG